MEIVFREHLWLGVTIWALLFISDYSFTIACARLYRRGVNEKIVFEGSFELTPYFQKDIDSLKKFSPRFLFVLVRTVIALSIIWYMTGFLQMPDLYSLVLGALVLLQLAVHKRHLQNFFLFRAILKSDQVRGRIEYPRPLILRQSSFELLAFAGMFALLALCTWSIFILGGALSCAATGAKHWQLSRIAMKSAAATA